MNTNEHKQPMQEVYINEHGESRFRKNAIVEYLLLNGSIRWDQIMMMDFPLADREQVAQQMGYSVMSYGDLHWISDETYQAAYRAATQAVLNDSKRDN
ncbi:hypothetical protein [Caballeronia sp. ATUFL_M1_KS5A]|uniref:hypothetical protein n=1 Tax=Caballeronia sp. ATUFL_M1_KS5A TaxID=2921778 RepID=UPI0020292387|nr:hypothetical protein [Caballeronia sp. ATUFL_M1_KS5A]